MIEYTLKDWQLHGPRSPILLRGARQVGKTYLVRKFGKENFNDILEVNFELNPEYAVAFKSSLEPKNINASLQMFSKKKIVAGKTLLFLDEVQECPRAIMALRYYKEKMSDLHVIAAGSLLEFCINTENFRMPVGRVLSLYLKPLSFEEFLHACGYNDLIAALKQATLASDISEMARQLAEKLLRIYFLTGGMPAAVNNYIERVEDLSQVQTIQKSLLNTYRNDFGKYASRIKHKYLQKVFTKSPGLITQQFKFSHIDPEMQARDLREALNMLVDAGLLYCCHATKSTGLPLNSLINEKKFKILFLDVGLVKVTGNLGYELTMQEDLFLANQGVLVEQFVGQELLAHQDFFSPGEVFYWTREKKGAMAEVDYIINIGDNIVPIEVKAGRTGAMRSLRYFLANVSKKNKIGIRLSMSPLAYKDNILSIPLYMISEIARLYGNIN